MRAKCLHVTQSVLMMQEQHAGVPQRGALICRTSVLVHNHERHIRAKVMIVEEAAHVLHESSSRHCLVRFSEERGICTMSRLSGSISPYECSREGPHSVRRSAVVILWHIGPLGVRRSTIPGHDTMCCRQYYGTQQEIDPHDESVSDTRFSLPQR